jgi:hypothetical protein
MQMLRALKIFICAAVCALLSYCLLTLTLSPAWVMLGVLPYGVLVSLFSAFPVFLFLQRRHRDSVKELWAAATVIFLSFGFVVLIFLDARTVLAFAMPASTRWDFPFEFIVAYWFLAVILASGVGALIIAKVGRQSDESLIKT